MIRLFNKNGNGQDELKECLTFINTSIKFDSLAVNLMLQEDQLVQEFGHTLIDELVAFYNSDEYDDPGDSLVNHYLKHLVYRAQLCVALFAYKNAAPNLDVIHSNSGRKIVNTDTDKAAFEHQIVRSDNALLDLADKAMDFFIGLLDDDPIEGGATSWKQSKFKTELNKLIISSASQFNEFYEINNSRTLFKKLVPFIKNIQIKKIKPALGDQFEPLITALGNNQISEMQENLLAIVRPALANLTMANAAISLNIKALPQSLIQCFFNTMDGGKSLNKDEISEFSNQLHSIGEKQMTDVYSFMLRLNSDTPVNPLDRHNPDQPFFRA